jgi:ABC-type transport system involved in multi-copper enzyme maturation permease subunit
MIALILRKELQALLRSPKFVATFAVCTLLILLSVIVGVGEYHAAMRQLATARSLADQDLRNASSWMNLGTRVFRTPDPLMILVAGVQYDVGRVSVVHPLQPLRLFHSPNADEPLFALFRSVDFAFLVTVVLSLFAILFTYDAVNGEREGGTLALSFAGPVSRAQFIIGKCAGAWLGLVVPLAIPVLLSVLILFTAGVPLGPGDLVRLSALLGLALLAFTFFIAFGIFTSTLTDRSSVSFLLALAGWVGIVLVVPRLGGMAATWIVPVPSVAEVEGRRDAYATDRWEAHSQEMAARWRARRAETNGMTEEESTRYRDKHLWAWTEEDDRQRKDVEREIDRFGGQLSEELRNRKRVREELSFALARISPAGAFHLGAMRIAGTDPGMLNRAEDAMRAYRSAFTAVVEDQQKKNGSTGGFRISMDSERGFSFSAPRERGSLDLSPLPAFAPAPLTTADALSGVPVDAGILAFASLLAFAGAWVAFRRYDVR